MRINADGSIPADNPFVQRAGARPEIWSYGHRNLQSAALHPQTGQLWTVEHGARGGDELNRPQAGRNYGWPVITYGVEYSGFKIGEGTAKAGMEQPVYYWDPVIAPSGAVFYTGRRLSRVARQPLRRIAEPRGARAAHARRRSRHARGALPARRRARTRRGAGAGRLLYLLTDAANGTIIRVQPTR